MVCPMFPLMRFLFSVLLSLLFLHGALLLGHGLHALHHGHVLLRVGFAFLLPLLKGCKELRVVRCGTQVPHHEDAEQTGHEVVEVESA